MELPPGAVEDVEFAALERDRYTLEVRSRPTRREGTPWEWVPVHGLTVVVLDPRRGVLFRADRWGEVYAMGFWCRVTGNHLLLLDGTRLTRGVQLCVSLERHTRPEPLEDLWP